MSTSSVQLSAVGPCLLRGGVVPSADSFQATPRSQSVYPEDFALPVHCDDGGRNMRKSLTALLLILGASAFSANLVLAAVEVDGSGDDLGMKLVNGQMVKELSSRASRLGTSTGSNTDTTFVGYTPGPTITSLSGAA